MICPVCQRELKWEKLYIECNERAIFPDGWSLPHYYRYPDQFTAIISFPYKILLHDIDNKTYVMEYQNTPTSLAIFSSEKDIFSLPLTSEEEAIRLLDRFKRLEAFL